jgi:hypothetical protein
LAALPCNIAGPCFPDKLPAHTFASLLVELVGWVGLEVSLPVSYIVAALHIEAVELAERCIEVLVQPLVVGTGSPD